MTAEQFKKANNLRSCGRCCATCRHGRDLCDDGMYMCVHKDMDGDSMYTDAESLCDKWEE